MRRTYEVARSPPTIGMDRDGDPLKPMDLETFDIHVSRRQGERVYEAVLDEIEAARDEHRDPEMVVVDSRRFGHLDVYLKECGRGVSASVPTTTIDGVRIVAVQTDARLTEAAGDNARALTDCFVDEEDDGQ